MTQIRFAGWFVSTVCAFTAAGCSCIPSRLDEVPSPGNAFVASVYADDCGAVAPNVLRVAVRSATEQLATDVVRIVETPFEAHVDWLSPHLLRITFDCSADRADCEAPPDRAWSVEKNATWKQVSIEYSLGPRLARQLNAAARERLLSRPAGRD